MARSELYVSNIILEGRGAFTENFAIFFSNTGKTNNLPEFEFERL